MEEVELEQLVVKAEPQAAVENSARPKRSRAPKAAPAEVAEPELSSAFATEEAPKPNRLRTPRKPTAASQPDPQI